MNRWDLSGAMSKRIALALAKVDGPPSWQHLRDACAAENAWRPMNMADEWMRWAIHEDAYRHLAAAVGVSAFAAFKYSREAARELSGALWHVFNAAEVDGPWKDAD